MLLLNSKKLVVFTHPPCIFLRKGFLFPVGIIDGTSALGVHSLNLND